ncbi:MAG: LacI family DNA-binding transcriptional regulator [Chloroherpetonaceae bacterium]|nr:LacI family transcriptional regulator [Chthonomonadaceae bacterium]MDW8209116.1 LacI family DNA-binding transcriptional regulator [Chloroherpetonaceae bacterium]
MVQNCLEKYIEDSALKPGDKLPTELDLCRQLGLSRATVNRALKEMEQRGLLVRRRGSGTYLSDPHATRGHARLLLSMRPVDLEDVYYGPLLQGILESASEQQVELILHAAADIPIPEDIQKDEVDGIVAISVEQDDVLKLHALHEAGIRVVGVALRSRFYTLPLICTDNFGGMRQAIHHLIDYGHRRIAFIASDLRLSDVSERLLGYFTAHAEAGVVPSPECLLFTYSCLRNSPDLITQWWSALPEPPTALLLHGTVAPLTLLLLQSRGIRVPQDVSVIVVDDIPINSLLSTPLTAIKQPVYQLGRRSIEKMLQMIDGTDPGQPEVLPTELVLRASVTHPCSES